MRNLWSCLHLVGEVDVVVKDEILLVKNDFHISGLNAS